MQNVSIILEWLAKEPVEDGLSIVIGYVALCVAIVSVFWPITFASWVFKIYITDAFIWFNILICVAIGIAAMFGTHDILNQYQHLYKMPLGPPLDVGSF